MPRSARKISSTGIYHVMVRGIDHTTIFHDDQDCLTFLYILRACKYYTGQTLNATTSRRSQGDQSPINISSPASDSAFDLYSYCLMGNHVHLLLREVNEPVHQIMKRVGIRYVSYYNQKYKRSGHLFQDRFKSVPVEDERALLATYRYIALNPVKARITVQAGKYEWCSFHPGNIPAKHDLFLSPLPVDIPDRQLTEFVRSDQQEINPFPERLSDRTAEMILLRVTGLEHAQDLRFLSMEKQKLYFRILLDDNLSVHQMSRLTGVPRKIIASALS